MVSCVLFVFVCLGENEWTLFLETDSTSAVVPRKGSQRLNMKEWPMGGLLLGNETAKTW